MNTKCNTWKGILYYLIKQLVNNICARISGCDTFQELEKPPLSMVKNISHLFFQFNLFIPDIETKKIHRIFGYDNPSLFGT